MSTAAAEHAHDVPADEYGTATNGKIAMWIFLLSDAFSFGGLLIGYGILRSGFAQWPNPKKYPGNNFTAGLAFPYELILDDAIAVCVLDRDEMKPAFGCRVEFVDRSDNPAAVTHVRNGANARLSHFSW